MRFFLALSLFLLSSIACASLKLQVQGNAFQDTGEMRPQFGLSYHQPIVKKLALNIWAGTGWEVDDKRQDTNWYVTKASLDFTHDKFMMGLGHQIKDSEIEGDKRDIVFVKLEYKLF